MIRYMLRCADGHENEAWFPSSAAFDRQVAAGLVECASCGSRAIGRGLMAPAVVGGARPPEPATAEQAAPVPARRVVGGAPAIPPAVRAVLGRLRAEVERNCEDVGPDFASEARRLHHGEREKRGIFGEATEAEREALADEGIAVARIPWLPRTES